jgi:hypothetical protein
MSFALKLTPVFARDAKRLSKKIRSLPNDLNSIMPQLREQPQSGTSIGHHCYKIRMAMCQQRQR